MARLGDVAHARSKVRGVNTGGHGEDRPPDGRRVQPTERLLVGVGDGKYEIESSQRGVFEAQHALPLLMIEPAPYWLTLSLGVASPDLGFDVVREHHRRAGE